MPMHVQAPRGSPGTRSKPPPSALTLERTAALLTPDDQADRTDGSLKRVTTSIVDLCAAHEVDDQDDEQDDDEYSDEPVAGSGHC